METLALHVFTNVSMFFFLKQFYIAKDFGDTDRRSFPTGVCVHMRCSEDLADLGGMVEMCPVNERETRANDPGG